MNLSSLAEGEKLRVAVVGAGAFGRNHLRVYRELEQAGYPVELAAVIEPDAAARADAEAKFGVRGFATIAECMAVARTVEVDWSGKRLRAYGASCGVRAQLMACGIDLLIEKPLAASLAEADEIAALAREHGRIIQVGHLERFNPAVRAVKALLNRPMFFEVHRLSVFTLRSLDVDVVLDLMIHDLDIVLKLVGEPVREVRAVGLPVLSNKVDIANVRLEFENGCVANFTASRVSTERVRKMRFFQPHQYLSLDFARQDLLLIDVTAAGDGSGADGRRGAGGLHPTLRGETAKDGAPEVLAGAHPSPGMAMTKVPVEAGEPLRLEIEAFLDAVRTRTQPVVTVEDGRAAPGLALEINASMAQHARRTGLSRR